MRHWATPRRFDKSVISNVRLVNGISAILLALIVGCARAPEAPPTATSAPQAAAKPAPTSIPAAAPAATSAPAAAPAPTSAPAAKRAPTSAPASTAAGAGGELVVGKDQEGPGLDPA